MIEIIIIEIIPPISRARQENYSVHKTKTDEYRKSPSLKVEDICRIFSAVRSKLQASNQRLRTRAKHKTDDLERELNLFICSKKLGANIGRRCRMQI